ncbi:MAG: YraN family protein [Clostridiales bacterium]|nr:YraN family protein [Clostridiales bacterium]
MAGVSKGAAGEVIAARFLREKGYTILGANVRSRFGEIDIIAAAPPYIAFVEVKTRSEDSLYAPREAVTQGKQVRILRTAALYLQGHPTDLQPRFDVIEVVTRKGRPMEAVEIDHLLGAYEAADLHTSF